ncbi:toll-like receptor 1 [Sphaeramia orbicularis]|uniref:toll-like receptor 1 n=1 Tax=Sphaeramia orbicularis TaxID=375764 RepID=UPI00117EAF03|nr:toll-like receptor 1 [Sphaeramia orbicularis]
MSAQSTNAAVLFGIITILSLLRSDCMAVETDENGSNRCVYTRQQMQDRSYQNLTEVPSGLPSDLKYLDMSHNSIPKLGEAALSGLAQLCFLKMTHCGLEEISPSVFNHTPVLKVLNVSHNYLKVIPDFSLKQLIILDLAHNLYDSYQIPESYQDLQNLTRLYLGSTAALSVNSNDFNPLTNLSLPHLEFGAGIQWQKYETGAFAKLKSLQKLSLHASFCDDFRMFDAVLRDVNKTGTTSLRLITVFPDKCNITGNPFKSLRTMTSIQSLTIENTWINSSFMEVFLKNVGLSFVTDLSFVNMTYNEDTPEGFQFRTINHTFSLRSVTFDGIHRYQHKRPTFNMNFDLISNLEYLKFSGSKVNRLPCERISVLPLLETLDLSDNLLIDTDFWWPGCSYTSVFPKLKHLSMSKNKFQSLFFIAQQTHQMKTLKSLDLSFNSLKLDGVHPWPEQLKELNLGNNNLGNGVFKYLSSNFERIDLSNTGITTITQDDLSPFTRLTDLHLSFNRIQAIPASLKAPALVSLYIDQNAITSISKEALSGFTSLQILKAGNNPFTCSCDSFWFVTHLNKSLLPDWPLQYICSTPTSYAGLSLSGLNELSCETWLQATVALSVIVVISGITGLVFYKCDGVWYTKMLWVWIRVKRRGQKRSHMLQNVSFTYHAFISYSHHDADWVDNQLVPSLEGTGFSLCIHERDFVPGDWIIDNIINCVESSYKTVFVLSEHFVQSEWCNYELFFAQHRAISVQQDSLVFILLEPIPTNSLPKKFLRLRSLLRQQTYLEWPKDERKQQIFWASLKSMLQMGNKSMVLKDVALAISDMAPLITNSAEELPVEL